MDVLSEQSEKEKALLLGNEAVVRGSLEADIDVATTYPGTPSSEIADTFSAVARHFTSQDKDPGFYFQYATNEKVALEFAAAAAVSGLRSLTCMKHVGLNVASDAFMTYMYVGCRAGHVIVSADDPSCHSSQNEQDNRYYAKFGNAPMLEPSTAQEVKDMTMAGFEISEMLKLPLLFRMTTRSSHVRGPVELGEMQFTKRTGHFDKDPMMVTVPAVARQQHPVLLEKMERAAEISEQSPFNRVEEYGGNVGIVTSGVAYNYVREVIAEHGLECRVLKLGMTNPLPREMCLEFMDNCRQVLVIEELEPYLEEQLRAMAQETGLDVAIHGKGYGGLRRIYEYDVDIVETAVRELFDMPARPSIEPARTELPPRPPVMCPGCPHSATYYAVKQVAPPDTIYPTDIGCYTLGKAPPLEVADFLLCMGSNVGTACGFGETTDQPVVSFMGDSTFFHSGLPGIVNAVHHDIDCVITVLDNRTTAMTGHQPHPGTERDGMGYDAVQLKVEDVVKGLGVQHVEVVNPNNVAKTREAFKRALDYDGAAVVVAKAPCRLIIKTSGSFTVDQDTCTQCETCIESFGCPAFYYDDDGNIRINETLCSACGVCTQICPAGAIRRRKQ
jgi:indolepyruvate ferredoxin oxidoreductase alpha subunit